MQLFWSLIIGIISIIGDVSALLNHLGVPEVSLSSTSFRLSITKVTFGRSSLVYQPHIDLSREGDSTRVSRCHGRIRLASNGTFWLANFSKHPVFVDGNPVLTGKLENQITETGFQCSWRTKTVHCFLRGLIRGYLSEGEKQGLIRSQLEP